MNPAEVLAIEIKQYATSNRAPVLGTLVPRVIGQSTTATDRKSASAAAVKFTETDYIDKLSGRLDALDVQVVEQIADWARSQGLRFDYRRGTKSLTFWPCFDHLGESYWPFAFKSDGDVEFVTQHLRKRRPFNSDEAITNLFGQLNEVPGLTLPVVISGKPRFRLDALRDESSLNQFLAVFQSIVGQIRSIPSPNAPP